MKNCEDLKIEKKYLNLMNKYIYDTKLDKFGMINSIELSSGIGGVMIMLKAYFDRIHSSRMVFFEDFKNGTMKFTIIGGETILTKEQDEKYNQSVIDDIKNAFGKDFHEDMIMYIDDEGWKERNRENDEREVQKISGRLINLKKFSAEIFYDDFTSCEAYQKYSKGDISETEMLYIICNYLCEELKRLKDDNLNYFIAKHTKEKTELLIDYANRKIEVDKKINDKIIDDECKENIFELIDRKLEDGEVSKNDQIRTYGKLHNGTTCGDGC